MRLPSGPQRRLWIRRLLRWSPLVTLPFVVFVSLWLAATFDSFRAFGIHYDARPIQARLRSIGIAELSHFRSKIAVALRPGSPFGELRTIDLFLGEADEAKLNERLPHSGRTYVRGHLLYPNGKSYRVKVRYRGDYGWHWAYYKKSLRIRTRRSRLFHGMRRLNLIAPKFDQTLNNHLAYSLARQLGLVAPHSEMVNLRVNGSYRGVYVLVEQLEELTLRRHRKMPGDLYSGELVGRDKYYGVRNRLADTPAFWEKLAVNNHYPEESYRPLEAFLALVRRRGGAIPDAAWDIVDVDAWGRFFALETLLQTFHFGDTHNWRLYYDPWRNNISPVVWDADGWHPMWLRLLGGKARLDVVAGDIHWALLANQRILLARHRVLENFFESGGDEEFFAEVDSVAAATQAALAFDPNVVHGSFNHLPPDDARRAVEPLPEAIRSTFRQVRNAYLGRHGGLSWQLGDGGAELRLALEGRRPVDAIELRTVPSPDMPRRVELVARAGDQQINLDVTGAVSVSADVLRVEVPLLARHVIRDTIPGDVKLPIELSHPVDLLPGHAALRFEPPLAGRLAEVRLEHGGRLETATEAEIGTPEPYPAGTVLAGRQPVRRPLRWRGDVRIDGVQVIKEDLFIDPGTTVHLAAGASLILEGRLVAEGLPDQPIRFLPVAGGEDPWGTLALRGHRADGSRLRHCRLEAGSGYKDDLAEYSAMLSIHDVHDVLIEDCLFRDNRIVDDMVHTVYADVVIRRSRFEGAPFDALDLDISRAVIQSSSFSANGNDAIDLMETEAVVLDSQLSGSGDKGISVGEGSRLWAINNVIEGNAIGVESKDTSIAVLANVTLRRNRQALHAYQKNWRYSTGGTIRLLKSIVQDHETPIDIKARSWLWIYDSSVDEPLASGKRVEIHPTVDRALRPAARVVSPVYQPDAEWGSSEFLETYWANVDASRRGAGE